MKFGLPRVVTSDQGTEFNNNLNRDLMKLQSNFILTIGLLRLIILRYVVYDACISVVKGRKIIIVATFVVKLHACAIDWVSHSVAR